MSPTFSPGSYGHHECVLVSCEIECKIHMTSVDRIIGLVLYIMPVCRKIMKVIIVELPYPLGDAEVNSHELSVVCERGHYLYHLLLNERRNFSAGELSSWHWFGTCMIGEAEGKVYRMYGNGMRGGRSVARFRKRFRNMETVHD
jgi:hypothetical protein